MKTLVCMALAGAANATQAQLPAVARVTVRTAASSPAAIGPSENFTGTVRVTAPFQALLPGRAGGATVSFEPRARTAWHSHPLGQTLVVTAGLGLVQQAGQPALVIRPGDVVTIPANVRHWHGAGPDTAMTHVAIAEKAEDGNAVTWRDKVGDADYQAALVSAGLVAGGPERRPQLGQRGGAGFLAGFGRAVDEVLGVEIHGGAGSGVGQESEPLYARLWQSRGPTATLLAR